MKARIKFDAAEFIIWTYRQESLESIGAAVMGVFSAAAKGITPQPYPWWSDYRPETPSRESVPAATRRLVIEAGRCSYCGATDELEIDHIRPVSKGGGNEIRNLQLLCRDCNREKGAAWPYVPKV